ncbi:RNA polymerase sigma-70 factor (ECF subfamily) [Luteibacter rhizovicinus]|uniref:RNA polymerase sigma-70 factor (ECF subfamily) n=1 Tax=Luteibacter rhizovicinus TaxID=242606 RepID=A0A4R3YTY2_9GAMM|nr:sigma-70 family RNA polymerase sigma factor [Luteibacter rhizovicinus]TCV94613.1 RNA polymerase sigma-70 factor (ECF subfamily) [Luteibacter rhizovicinus]
MARTAAEQLFHPLRARLTRLAWRMLGSVDDAEDIVQEAWLRWHTQDVANVESAEAWLVTATTRLALDRLRRAKLERADYPGRWLAEPWVAANDGVDASPEDRLERAETLSTSYIALLERLGAEERAAFLLHDIFDLDYPAIATMIGRSEAACRQRVHRARTRLQTERAGRTIDNDTKRRLLERFAAAIADPTEETLGRLLADNATLIGDGGGIRRSVLRPLHGAMRILAMYERIAAFAPGADTTIADLRGEPVLLTWRDGELYAATWIESDDERIHSVRSVLNPEKLRRLEAFLRSAQST